MNDSPADRTITLAEDQYQSLTREVAQLREEIANLISILSLSQKSLLRHGDGDEDFYVGPC